MQTMMALRNGSRHRGARAAGGPADSIGRGRPRLLRPSSATALPPTRRRPNPTRRRGPAVSTVRAVWGVQVASEEKLGDNRVQLTVAVSGNRTARTLEDSLDDLGKSVEFPKFQRRRRNAPLPAAMIVKAFGEEKVAQYAASKMIVEMICDHAKENGRLVRADLEASMAVESVDTIAKAFEAGQPVSFTAVYDFVGKDYQPPTAPQL